MYFQKSGFADAEYAWVWRISLRARSFIELNMPRDHLALNPGEPDLDLVEPRRIGRCEVQLHIGMLQE